MENVSRNGIQIAFSEDKKGIYFILTMYFEIYYLNRRRFEKFVT